MVNPPGLLCLQRSLKIFSVDDLTGVLISSTGNYYLTCQPQGPQAKSDLPSFLMWSTIANMVYDWTAITPIHAKNVCKASTEQLQRRMETVLKSGIQNAFPHTVACTEQRQDRFTPGLQDSATTSIVLKKKTKKTFIDPTVGEFACSHQVNSPVQQCLEYCCVSKKDRK